MGRFTIIKRKNGEYQFSLKSTNGEILLSSEGYYTKSACLSGIESIRRNGIEDARFDKFHSSNGKYYFNLKASNGQIIGTSEMYGTSQALDLGIEAVKRNVVDASIEDLIA
jgi:uncharacterized protein YegP (UPF0339 family)